ncbi:MAG: DUF917 domain-containing protein [Pseudomonadota bacterium]
MTLIGKGDIEDLAYGAAFLGTGGGGDPYLGKLFAQQAVMAHGAPDKLPLQQLADDAAVFCVAMMGAPTVLVEKMFSMEDMDLAVRTLERHLGLSADAILPAEIGGVNATIPVAYAAFRGLPVVDADGMGRAFPSLEMITFNVEGIACTPMSLANEHGESQIIKTETALEAENAARPVVVEWGGAAMVCLYPMTGAQAKASAVSGTLTLAQGVGEAVRTGRENGDPVETLLTYLRSTDYYGQCGELFDGKIVDISRDLVDGWNVGRCKLQALDDPADRMTLVFQNEHLVAYRNDRVVTIVPDLIAVIDRETAEPIATESLRYGQRVKVIGTSAAPIMRTARALEVFGPKCFKLNEDFQPIETLIET